MRVASPALPGLRLPSSGRRSAIAALWWPARTTGSRPAGRSLKRRPIFCGRPYSLATARELLRQTGQIEPVGPGALDRTFVACIGMTHDPRRRIVPKHPLDTTRGLRRSVGDNHHAGVLRIADADAAAVMQRDPRGP